MHGPYKFKQRLGRGGSEEEWPEKGSAAVSTGRAGRYSCQLASELYVCGFQGEAQEVGALSRGKNATRFPPGAGQVLS